MAGEVEVTGIIGDKDVELSFGDLTVEANPEDYAHVDASVYSGDLICLGIFADWKFGLVESGVGADKYMGNAGQGVTGGLRRRQEPVHRAGSSSAPVSWWPGPWRDIHCIQDRELDQEHGDFPNRKWRWKVWMCRSWANLLIRKTPSPLGIIEQGQAVRPAAIWIKMKIARSLPSSHVRMTRANRRDHPSS